MKRIMSLVFLLASLHNLVAQSLDEYKKQQLAQFEAYKKQARDDFDDYRKNANAEFAAYMRQAWKRFEKKEPIMAPDIPDIPPVVLPDLDEIVIPDNEIPYDDIVPIVFDDEEPIPLIPLPKEPDRPDLVEPRVEVCFYGTDCSVRFDESGKGYMNKCSERAAADLWEEFSEGAYDSMIIDCLNCKKNIGLCDWAYYKLAETVAEKIYGSSNEAVMLQAYIMSQSGYKLRLGRTDDDKIHILLGAFDGMFGYPYYVIGSCDYYLTDGSSNDSMYIFDRAFPGEKAIRLTISSRMALAPDIMPPRILRSAGYADVTAKVSMNRNLMSLYADYPHPFRKGDQYTSWIFYASAPLSLEIEYELYPALRSEISGLDQYDAANILLNFVQTAFEYKTDGEFWGYERSFFPEETLYYPYCDCEDRAILYSRLVRDLLGLEVVFLYYPNHLATAVAFEEDVPGDYILLDGKRYVVCDPTYINASVGMTMPSMDNSTVKVIVI